MIKVFNEKAYAEKMMQNGFLSTNVKFELRILAKYFLFEHKKPTKEIKDILISFCDVWVPRFRFEVYYKIINSVLNYVERPSCKYITIDGIFISDEFVQYINNLEMNSEMKKLLFALGVWGEVNLKLGYSQNYAYSYSDYRDLREAANIQSGYPIYDMMHELYKTGYIRACYTGAIELVFLEQIPKGEPIYKIVDFKNIGNWLDFYNGVKGYSLCKKCKTVFKKSNAKANSQIYCKECSKPEKTGSKLINCEVCDKMFFVSSKTTNKTKCKTCYSEHRQEYFHHRPNL